MLKSSFTLLELIVATVLLGILVSSTVGVSIFFISRVATSMERANLESQINHAFEDMRLRLISARTLFSQFLATGETRNSIEFSGENNIFNITPEVTNDNVTYRYQVDVNGRLVLLRTTNPTCAGCTAIEPATAVLVESRYALPASGNPVDVSFNYRAGDEPNFITVTITARTRKTCPTAANCGSISRTEGISFWFCDAAIP
jgi:type II secretory pathway pseudopilin PulG